MEYQVSCNKSGGNVFNLANIFKLCAKLTFKYKSCDSSTGIDPIMA